jgi:hypothetical protein
MAKNSHLQWMVPYTPGTSPEQALPLSGIVKWSGVFYDLRDNSPDIMNFRTMNSWKRFATELPPTPIAAFSKVNLAPWRSFAG